MRNWLAIILLLLLDTAGAETNAPTSLRHISPDDFTTKTLGRETVEGRAHLIVQAEARNGRIANNLGYYRLRAWYDMDDKVTRKVLLLDRDNVVLTTIRFCDFFQVDGSLRAGQMEVTDHSSGKTTVWQFDENTNSINPVTII